MIIYCFTNKINGKCYIGQAVNFERRKYRHLWDAKNNNDNNYFHNALKKYGEDNFKCDVLCECNSKEELDEMEKYYIKSYNTKWPNGYNLTDGGEGMSGYKFTEEVKKKMSNSHTGKKLSDETKKKMSKSKLNMSVETKRKMGKARKGRKHTDEIKKKMCEINKGNKNCNKNWEVIYPNGEIKIVNGLKDWCIENNFNYSNVFSSINKNKSYKCFIIKRAIIGVNN